MLTYGITDEQAGTVGLPCGGEIDVGIERVALSELERLVEEAAPHRLVVFGAVDIAEALCRGAKELGWDTVVADPRATFATRDRISSADELLVEWPETALERIALDEQARSSCSPTRSDSTSRRSSARCAATRSTSARSARGARRSAAASGCSRKACRRPRSIDSSGPTGLDLGAETPAETAVSILAEILAVRAGRSGGRLRDASGRIHAELQPR